jgi:jumonji domain-containing protein 7
MAAPMDTRGINMLQLLIISIFLEYSISVSSLYTYEANELSSVLEESCFIGASVQTSPDIVSLFTQLMVSFRDEPLVTVGTINLGTFIWPNGQDLRIHDMECKTTKFPPEFKCINGFPDIVFFPKKDIDRSCLLRPAHLTFQPAATVVSGDNTLDELVLFINAKCHTFRRQDGGLLPAGYHRKDILNHVYNFSQVSDINMNKLHSSNVKFLKFFSKQGHNSHYKDDEGVCNENYCEGTAKPSQYTSGNSHVEVPKCDSIEYNTLNMDTFFHEYVKKSRPIVIKNGVRNWPAFNKWSQDYLREQYGNRTVHVKITPGGDFEGVESVEQWENYQDFNIPDEVK